MSHSRLFYASQALMILARDFDNQEISTIEASLKDVIAAIWGHNAVGFQHNAEISLVASAIFYLCTLRSGGNTVGQDYCNLDMKQWTSLYLTALPTMRKALLFLFLSLSPYIVARSPTFITTLCGTSTASIVETLASLAEDIHITAFYFFGRYLEPAYRLTSVRLATDKIPPHRQKQLQVLSYLIGLRCLITCGSLIRQVHALTQSAPGGASDESPTRNRAFSRAYYTDSFEQPEQDRQWTRQAYCSLCMEHSMAQPTTTKCGHVFCWECIAKWLAKQPRCPVCRDVQQPQQLRALHNY